MGMYQSVHCPELPTYRGSTVLYRSVIIAYLWYSSVVPNLESTG